MTRQTINVGTTANDGTGDSLRAAAQKVNSNFLEVYGIAQGAFDAANSGTSLLSSQLLSNTQFISAVNSTQNSSIGIVFTTANAAFTAANTAQTTATAGFIAANTAQTTATAGFTAANTAQTTATAGFTAANSAFVQANAATSLAQNAYNYANTIISDTLLDPWARNQVNAAFNASNTVSVNANSAFLAANSAQSTADASFIKANSASVLAQAAFDKANTSPTSLANSLYTFGMTDNGFINFNYNNTTYLNMSTTGITSYGQMVLESANSVSGNNSAVLFDRNGSGIVFRLEDNTPISKNWGFYQTNVLFPDGTRQYTAANDTLAQAAFNAANSAMTPSSLYANNQTLSLSANTLTYSSPNLQIINDTNCAINFSQSGVSVTVTGVDEQENDLLATWRFAANGAVILPSETTFNSNSGTISVGTTDLTATTARGSFIQFYDTSSHDSWFNLTSRDKNAHSAAIYAGANSASGLLYTQISTYDGGAVYGQKDWTFHKSGKTQFPIVTAPTSSVGESGDTTGMVAFTQDHMYFCVGVYDGASDIWKRIAWPNETW